MSKRKLDPKNSFEDAEIKRRRIDYDLDDLPDEVLVCILNLLVTSIEAKLTCRKWSEIIRSYHRTTCFQRWQGDIEYDISHFDTTSAERKEELLERYFIPVSLCCEVPCVDWRRYYLMRSNYEQLLKFLGLSITSELIADRIAEAMHSLKKPLDTPEKSLCAAYFFCDAGSIDLERKKSPFLDSWNYCAKLWHVKDRKGNTKICRLLLKLYHLAKLRHAKQEIQQAVLSTLTECFIKSSFDVEICRELLKADGFISRCSIKGWKNIFWYPLQDVLWGSDLFNTICRATKDLFEEFDLQKKLSLLDIRVPDDYKERYNDAMQSLVIDYLEHNGNHEILFVDWLTDILNLEESRDEAYSTYLNIVLKESNLDYFYDATKQKLLANLVMNLTESRVSLLSDYHLKALPSLLKCSKIADPKRFCKNLTLLRTRLDPYLPLYTDFFMNDSYLMAKPFFESTLSSYPAEAIKVILNLTPCNANITKMIADEFELIQRSFGDRWEELKNEFVQKVLGLFPEQLRDIKLALPTNENLSKEATTVLALPAMVFNQTQLGVLNRLLLVACEHTLSEDNQRQVLNLTLAHVKAFPHLTFTVWLPFLENFTAETLPYHVALMILLPDAMMADQFAPWIENFVISLIVTYPETALECIQQFARGRLSIVTCAHIVCFYGIRAFKETCLHGTNYATEVKTLLDEALLYLVNSAPRTSYDVVNLMCILLACSMVHPRIEEFTCHKHDWIVVRGALAHTLVQDILGVDFVNNILNSGIGFIDMIPYFKNK